MPSQPHEPRGDKTTITMTTGHRSGGGGHLGIVTIV